MGRQPGPRSANPTSETSANRSLNEWVVLALLVEEPTHGFAAAKALAAGGDLGRILTVRRPLVYRALDRLADAGWVEPVHTEPGDAGPNRTVFRPTGVGRNELERWLATPVAHVRDLRVEFLLKLRLLERRDRNADKLVAAQRASLDETIERLIERPALIGSESDPGDVVDLWRSNSARAARRFLDELDQTSIGRCGDGKRPVSW